MFTADRRRHIERLRPRVQVTSIQWSYKTTDDIVKVEVWDVVDKAKLRKKIAGLKLDNTLNKINEEADDESEPALDAEFIDVYKGTNGVIMLFDVTKSWTFEYVQRELPKVPSHIPVLVLANHVDMGHHRAVTEDQVRTFIEELGRNDGSGQIRYAEASMRNGFGLKFLHKFFNLPFLHLQRETLLKQLETNCADIRTTCEELDVLQESDEQNYDKFLDMLTNRRRQVADQLSQVPPPMTTNPADGPPRSMSMPANLSSNQGPPGVQPIIKPSPSIIVGAHNPLPVNGVKKHVPAKAQPVATQPTAVNTSPGKGSLKNVDDFVPEDEQAQFRSFLEEAAAAKNATSAEIAQESER